MERDSLVWLACWLNVFVYVQCDLEIFKLADAAKQFRVVTYELVHYCEVCWWGRDGVYDFDEPQFICCLVAEQGAAVTSDHVECGIRLPLVPCFYTAGELSDDGQSVLGSVGQYSQVCVE